jgi:hypothetical protein
MSLHKKINVELSICLLLTANGWLSAAAPGTEGDGT